MENNTAIEAQGKSLYGVKGWLIVFTVFLPINQIITFIHGFAFEYAVFLALITLVFTVLIMIFLFTKKQAFRLLFVILMGLDLGFCLANIFMRGAIAELYYYQAPLVFLLICLAKLLFFTIYLFRSKRVKTTYSLKPNTLSGASSAFLMFAISFLVINIISLFETASYTGSSVIRYNQIPYISNLMAYIVSIILGLLIIYLIIRRKPAFRPAFIAMMIIQVSLLFHVFSCFGTGYIPGYELYSSSLHMNVGAQAFYALLSLVAWTVVIYRSKGIRADFKAMKQ